jgi:branched-chain amino acid transport system ATP-binding protein
LKTRRNNSRHTFRREQQMLAISKAWFPSQKCCSWMSLRLDWAYSCSGNIQGYPENTWWEKVSILLVEQNARKALSIADYGYILETGKIVISGPAVELKENEQIKAAYLGGARIQAT